MEPTSAYIVNVLAICNEICGDGIAITAKQLKRGRTLDLGNHCEFTQINDTGRVSFYCKKKRTLLTCDKDVTSDELRVISVTEQLGAVTTHTSLNQHCDKSYSVNLNYFGKTVTYTVSSLVPVRFRQIELGGCHFMVPFSKIEASKLCDVLCHFSTPDVVRSSSISLSLFYTHSQHFIANFKVGNDITVEVWVDHETKSTQSFYNGPEFAATLRREIQIWAIDVAKRVM